jgi:tetratricopeptide (TPR) repeat protein
MRTARTLLAVTLVALPLASGCNGPTKAGQEARKAARERADEASAVIVYDQAMQSFKAGQFERSIKEIDEAIFRLPEEARFWTLRGRINLETGKLEQAERDFTRAIEIDETFAEARYRRGLVYERWNDHAKAHDDYVAAADRNPEKLAYTLAAAEMLVAQDRPAEAKAWLEPKLERFANSGVLNQLLGKIDLIMGDAADASRRLNRAMVLDPNLPMVLEDLVRAQWAAGEWDECLQNVRRLRKERADGQAAELLRLEGRCLVRLERFGDARVVFSELTRAHPQDVLGWIDLGTTAWMLGDVNRTRSAGDRLVEIAPRRFEGYLLLGLVAREGGQAAESRAMLEKARTLAGDRSDVPAALLALEKRRPLPPSPSGGPRANEPVEITSVPEE